MLLVLFLERVGRTAVEADAWLRFAVPVSRLVHHENLLFRAHAGEISIVANPDEQSSAVGIRKRRYRLCKLAGISHAVLEVLPLVLAFTNQAEKKGFVVRDSSYHSSTFCSARKATSCFCKRSLCPRYLSSEMTLFSSLGSFLRS